MQDPGSEADSGALEPFGGVAYSVDRGHTGRGMEGLRSRNEDQSAT